MEKTLARDFSQESLFIKGYDSFMEGLLQIVKNRRICDELGKEIEKYAQNYVQHHSLVCFNHFSEDTYVRNYIGRDPATHWEALVMCWKKGNRTAIHAHPQYAGYTFADGIFLVEIFEPTPHGIHLKEKLYITNQQSLYAIGEAGRFDNHIHRITCLSETAHSVHIYSDDALKGLKYDEI